MAIHSSILAWNPTDRGYNPEDHKESDSEATEQVCSTATFRKQERVVLSVSQKLGNYCTGLLYP